MKSHYLIFHPDRERELVKISGKAIINNQLKDDWTGMIWSDKRKHNEDPFIYDQQWVYSYCHATQLSRAFKKNFPFVQAGSVLFFCSGDYIDKNEVVLDTVFCVQGAYKWVSNQLTGPQLPYELEDYFGDNSSPLWERHLKYPFQNQHYTPKKGNYTYISAKFAKQVTQNYSFLPLKDSGIRTSFPTSILNDNLVTLINEKKNGKRPVPLTECYKNELLDLIYKHTMIQVVEVQKELS